jgi:hypothetical protein
MIVFDLKCAGGGHVFEAWFSNSAAYEEQRRTGLLTCPMCGDGAVSKAAMAPAVPSKGNRTQPNAQLPVVLPEGPSDGDIKALMESMAKAQNKALEKSKWVGKDFDRQARAMDAGDTAPSTIHGEVTKDEAISLIEDGIAVMPLPFPVIPPEKRN